MRWTAGATGHERCKQTSTPSLLDSEHAVVPSLRSHVRKGIHQLAPPPSVSWKRTSNLLLFASRMWLLACDYRLIKTDINFGLFRPCHSPGDLRYSTLQYTVMTERKRGRRQ